MFRCENCGREFEEPAFHYEDPSPRGITGLPPGYETYLACPYCDSEYVEEFDEEEEEDEYDN